MADQVRKGASLLPDDMVQGGLIGDPPLNLKYTNMQFVVWDYDGKTQKDENGTERMVTVLAVRGELIDDEGKIHNQYWSSGDPALFQPSPDGKRAVPVGRAEALSSSTNLAVLMAGCINAGFPKERISDDITTLNGMVALSHRVPAPERGGSNKRPTTGEQKFKPTVLVPSKILRLPWENGGAEAAPTTGSAGAGANTDVMSDAMEYAAELLAEKGEVTKGQLTGGVFAKRGQHPNKAAIVKLVHTKEFLDALVESGIAVVEGDKIRAT